MKNTIATMTFTPIVLLCSAIISNILVYCESFSAPTTTTSTTANHKFLVLGSSGFLGQQIVKQLDELGIPYVTASGRDKLDLTSSNAADMIAELAKGCDAVITTVGSIGSDDDELINAANGAAAKGAEMAGCVDRFVAIGNDPKVRTFSKTIPMLQNYAKGKETSEEIIKSCFPDGYTIVQPTFIHGGDEFTLNPPRVPSRIGQLAEDILGLYPIQSASEVLPGVLGIALQAPISRDRVASACINAALGLAQGDLKSRDDILLAASKRPQKELLFQEKQSFSHGEEDKVVDGLKQKLYDLGDCEGDAEKLDQAFRILADIENCNVNSPTIDPRLNGRWDFVMDVEADIGTGIVKDILEGNSPIQVVFDLKDLYMMIENNSIVTIFVNTKLLSSIPVELKLTTNLIPDESDPTGTSFLEQFQGIELGGATFPVPKDWQRSRPLEFSYLDDTMLIARGNGAEPHYLRRNYDDEAYIE